MNRVPLSLALSLLALSPTLVAQYAPPSGTPERLTPPTTQICVECHGPQGQGQPGAPRIAGQSAHYLAKQLRSYADGTRRNPLMEPIAKSLSAPQIDELAAFYAQTQAPVAGTVPPAAPSERAQRLATVGDAQRRVQACDNCHGPAGVGQPPTIPYLAGLDAKYIADTLMAWRNGVRRNDAGRQMATVANALAPEDLDAIAQYYAQRLPPPPPLANLVQAPPRRAQGAPRTRTEPAGAQSDESGAGQGAPAGGGTGGTGATGAGEREVVPPEPDGATAPQSRREGDPARGRALLAANMHGCIACHTIPGIKGARGIVGPPLGGIAARAFIAGQLPNEPDTLIAFLQNPPALVPATGMPDVGLTAQEARDVAAFLYTLDATDAR